MIQLYNIIYLAWAYTQYGKLGSQSPFAPMPVWLRNILNKYSIRTRVVLYARILKGSRVHDDSVDKDVACANVVTGILNMVDSTLMPRRINGTWTLSDAFSRNPRFTQMTKPVTGCIILSPTGKGYRGKVGHVGVIDLDGKTVLSNNSYTGRLDAHIDVDEWEAKYCLAYGIPTEYWIINY